MVKAVGLALMASIITTVGQLILKVGMIKIGPITNAIVGNPIPWIQKILTSPFIIAAMVLYSGGFVVWLVVLSKLDLSHAYPFLALAYILVPLLSWLILGENIPAIRWVGIIVVSIGIILVGLGK